MERVIGIAASGIVLMGSLSACKSHERPSDESAADAAAMAKEETGAAQESPDETAAKLALVQKHIESQRASQEEFDAIARKVTSLQAQLAKATGQAKKSADAAMAEVTQRQRAAQLDIDELGKVGIQDSIDLMRHHDAATGDVTWDAAKRDVDRDVAAFKRSVDVLEKALGGAGH